MAAALAADENFHGDIVEGLRRRIPDLDLVRLQDAGLTAAPDSQVLAWAAEAGRVLLTHDIRTMPGYAYERVQHGQPMAGVIEVPRSLPIGRAIAEIVALIESSRQGDFDSRVVFLPRR